MNIRPIKNDDDLAAALDRIKALWGSADGSPERDEFEVLAALVENYEREHYPIPPPTLAGALQFAMDDRGLTRKDLEPIIGPASRISEIMLGKRGLTSAQMIRVHEALKLPYDCLVFIKPEEETQPARGMGRTGRVRSEGFAATGGFTIEVKDMGNKPKSSMGRKGSAQSFETKGNDASANPQKGRFTKR